MLRPEGLIGASHRRSRICVDWELRVTRRCLNDDLGIDPDEAFDDYPSREIIKAFVKDRDDHTDDSKTISGLSCGETLYRLGYGDRHRGCTWYDEENEIVWLCAYGRHESGDPTDAFKYFAELDAQDELLPDDHDYQAVVEDEGYRFVESIVIEMPLLLRQARRETEVEHRAKIAGTIEVGLLVESAPPYESVTLAVTIGDWQEDDWELFMTPLLAALGLGDPDALGNVDGIGQRRLRADETGAEFTRLAPI